LRQWVKTPGATVAKGDLLALLETETASVELVSNQPGVLAEILVKAGTTVRPSDALAKLQTSKGETAVSPSIETPLSKPHPVPVAATPAPGASLPGPQGEVIPILMPQAGQSMEEGTIVKWHVQPGSQVEKGQILFDVETDKAVIEVEADHSGRLARIVAEVDSIVAIKVPVAYLAENDADVDAYLAQHGNAAAPASSGAAPSSASTPSVSQAVPATPRTPAALTSEGRVKASPAARKAAAEKGIALEGVGAGSGPGGRILSTDVANVQTIAASATETRQPLTGMRKAIARNLTLSKQTIPHFYMRQTIEAEAMMAYNRERKAEFPCSINDVITMACARAIREFPAFRSRMEGDEIVQYPGANIGIAVGLENGLVVPVVCGADRMNLRQLAGETRRIVEAARGGKLEAMGQGVFTISNLGMFGIEEFSAIINPPEAAILAVSAIRETCVVHNGAIRAAKVMTLTISCDHRLIDGLMAARFMAKLKELLEGPEQL
jgi:pyruvate dehydrogenase E2 component (dihydrolipoamide acetyltransferase)